VLIKAVRTYENSFRSKNQIPLHYITAFLKSQLFT
jgi:hypothetical protein